MTYIAPRRPVLFALTALALLAGCSGSPAQQEVQAIYTVPTPRPTPYLPPVSESYAARNAPVQEQFAPLVPVERSPAYQRTDLFEANSRANQVEAQSVVNQAQSVVNQAQVQTQPSVKPLAPPPPPKAQAQRSVGAIRRVDSGPAQYQSGFAPFEANRPDASTPTKTTSLVTQDDPGLDARERAAETAAKQQTRREAARVARANPEFKRKSFFGRFVTRADSETRPEPASRALPAEPTPRPTERAAIAPRPTAVVPTAKPATQVAALTPPAPQAAPTPPARSTDRSVGRAPIPGLKPYILARSPSPASKPRRAPQPQSREFEVATASVLPGAGVAAVPPSNVVIPTEPGVDLSASFFPTPGKPSVLGTDQDKALDVASIDATRYGIGKGVGDVIDGEAATAKWTDAVRLIESGEVEALAILEDADLVLTLCSGRDIQTTPPDLAAAATLTAPQIICGQNKPLALR